MVQASFVLIILVCSVFAEFITNNCSPFIILITLINCPSLNNMTTLLTLIAYKSFTARQEFDEMIERKVSLVIIYKTLRNIDKSISRMDQYVSIFIFFSLFLNTLFTVSAICHLALSDDLELIESLTKIIFGILNLSMLCYLCNVIPASLGKLINKVENQLDDNDLTNGYDSENRQIVLQMREISTRIGFTAFGFFRVKSNTFLTCLAQIISYSVIIIQTASPNISDQTHQNCTCSSS